MTDPDNERLESRARAAARAVHEAVDDPAATVATSRRTRGPIRALAIAAAVTVIAVVGTTVVVENRADSPADGRSDFCAQFVALLSTPTPGSESNRSLEFLRDAPDEIRADALTVLAGSNRKTNDPGSDSIAASQRFVTWSQLHCFPDAATSTGGAQNQRFAPTLVPPSLLVCSVSNISLAGTEARVEQTFGTITIYGDPSLTDPYAGKMIGVIRSAEQQYYRDDHAVPAVVPGHPNAELIDATGLYGAPIEGLGQAVTWRDDRGFVTVVGRGYSREQGAELSTIAAGVGGPSADELTDPVAAGLKRMYHGAIGNVYQAYPSPTAPTTFLISYLVSGSGDVSGIANFTGTPGDAAAFEASQFFTRDLHHVDVAGTDTIQGTISLTNSGDASANSVTIWRAGGTILTLRSPAPIPPGDIATFVGSTRLLDRSEWEQLFERTAPCSATAASSGRSSAARSARSTGTSSASLPIPTTVPVPQP